MSRRTLLRASIGGTVGLLTACTLDNVKTTLPEVTPLPIENVSPRHLPTATPNPQSSPTPLATAIPDATPVTTNVTISFETWGPRSMLEAFSEIFRTFQSQFPSIQVRARLDNALTSDGQRQALQLGGGADVTRIAPADVFDFTAAGFLHGLGDRTSSDSDLQTRVPRSIDARVGPGGERSVLTVGAAFQCVLYNQEHFESSGVTAPTSWANPWTVSEFEQVARRLVVADTNRVERFALAAIPAYTRPVLSTTHNARAGGVFLDTDERVSQMATADNELRLRRLATWQTALDIELPIPDRFAAPFSGGLTAMYIDRSDVGPSIRSSIPWAIAPLPAWNKTDAQTEADELCLGINATSVHPDSAWSLVRFLTGPEAQRSFARTDLVVPFRTEILVDPAFLEPNRRPLDRTVLREAADQMMKSPAHPGSKAWHKLTGPQILAVRRGDKSAGEYLREADRIITRQLKVRNWSSNRNRPGYRQSKPYGNHLLQELHPPAG
jgi:multiple sugar transport system substrate-binding protein